MIQICQTLQKSVAEVDLERCGAFRMRGKHLLDLTQTHEYSLAASLNIWQDATQQFPGVARNPESFYLESFFNSKVAEDRHMVPMPRPTVNQRKPVHVAASANGAVTAKRAKRAKRAT